ncbi:hypothetical protein [Gluconobacter oxydans]|uniref:Uncharacterized protein n=1 Tax=Gluconobacter oxydans NBRC 3293 TaxID=1315969 RepID=A0A829WI96_GLUOY|nr:hypothetical protein [Gluconobacter oxydans]GEM16528.1 hypothetical protein NBRC3293_1025 [Gluconobacter oxydans NBRC 3293]
MNRAALRSSGSTRAGFVQGLFSVYPGGIVGAGAARSGRRTPEPHVWPAAPLQFMRGDGWRGAAMEETTGKWVGLADALREIVSAQVWDQCRVAWEACAKDGRYNEISEAVRKSRIRFSISKLPSSSPALYRPVPQIPVEIQALETALNTMRDEFRSFACASGEKCRIFEGTGSYQPPGGVWKDCSFVRPLKSSSSSFEDFIGSLTIRIWLPKSKFIRLAYIQIFRAEETAASEPAVSSVKKSGGPGRPEKAETTFARILVRAWLEEEGEDLSERGKQSDCLTHVISDLIAKYGNNEIPSESTVKKLIKEESEKLKAEKEKARKSARN